MTAAKLDLGLEERLRGTSTLSTLTDRQFSELLVESEILNYRLGEVIAISGRLCDGLYFLSSGKVRITTEIGGGKTATVCILSRPGDFWGSECWQRKGVWGLAARAAADSVVVRLKAERVRQLCAQAASFQKQLEQEHLLVGKSALLKQCAGFDRLAYHQARSLVLCANDLKLQAGEKNDASKLGLEGMFIILSGSVQVDDGTTKHILSPGATWGKESLSGSDSLAPVTVSCLKSAELLILARSASQELARYNPELVAELESLLLSSQVVSDSPVAKAVEHEDSAAAANATDTALELVTREPVFTRLRRTFRRYPYISQENSMDCGVTCLAMVSLFYGRSVSLRYLGQLADVTRYGTSMLSLVETADKIGLTATGFKASYEGLLHMKLPVICHWKQNHFVVLYEINLSGAVIGDPGEDLMRIPRDRFTRHYSGVALELTPTQKFGKSFKGKKALPLLFSFLAPFHSLIRDILVTSLIYQTLMILTPLFTQVIVDKVIVHQNVSMLNMMLLGMVIFTLFESVMSFLRSVLLAFFAMKADKAIYSQFFRHLLTLPLGFFESKTIGDVLARLNENRKIREFLSGSGATVILDSVVICVYFVIIFAYSLAYGLAALTYLSLLVALMVIYTPILRNLSRLGFDKQVTCDSFVVESIRGMETVKSAAAEIPIRCKWEEYFTDSLNIRLKEMLARDGAQVLSRVVHLGGYVALLYLGANLVIEDKLTVGQLMALNMMIEMVSQPVMRVIEMWDSLQNVNTALERVSDVLEAEPEEPDPTKKIVLTDLRGDITFESVTFRYSQMDERNTLVNVSFKAHPSQTVALVGRSGSGKSTLLKLIQGLYSPVLGRIFVDGHDIAQLSLSQLRKEIGVVSQQDYFFRGTVRETISTHRPGVALEEIVNVAKQVGLHDFIVSLPSGYETHISEAAHNLSGGQRQRLAIARAILHRPRILILDEPTSALDPESERHIQDSLQILSQGRTVFVAAHRLSTVRDANLILVMDRGQIVETGNHESLMAERGLYYYLCKEQLRF